MNAIRSALLWVCFLSAGVLLGYALGTPGVQGIEAFSGGVLLSFGVFVLTNRRKP